MVRGCLRLGALVAGTGLAAAGCTPVLDMEALRGAVSEGVSEQLGLEVAEVACPESREAKTDDVFECEARGDERSATVVVTVRDRDGRVGWSLAGAPSS